MLRHAEQEEPWGVVLHEMAISGLPLIASHQVGAATAHLRDAANGWTCAESSLKRVLKQFIATSEVQVQQMGHHSHQLGIQTHLSMGQDPFPFDRVRAMRTPFGDFLPVWLD